MRTYKEMQEYANKLLNETPSLHRHYGEGEKLTGFRPLQIRVFGYATQPVILDFETWVEISFSNHYMKVSLGTYFEEHCRKGIPFGEDYFRDTKDKLQEIAVNSWKWSFEDRPKPSLT